jgi:uncharacterized protein (TIGR00369 family)
MPERPKRDLSEISDFQRQIGIERIEAADGSCRIWLQPDLARNAKGDIHGGALAALCDTAMARAVRSANLDIWGLSTVSMTIDYLAPAAGLVIAEASVTKNGSSLAFAKTNIISSAGTLLVQASGVFRKIREKRP